MIRPLGFSFTRPISTAFFPIGKPKIGYLRSLTSFSIRSTLEIQAHSSCRSRNFSHSFIPNPNGNTVKKTKGIGVFVLLGGILLTSVGLYAIEGTLNSQLDVTPFSDEFAKMVSPIVNQITPLIEPYRNGQTKIRPVVAVAGCSGVGKSFFSDQLLLVLKEMGIKAKILHFDDFIDPERFEGAKDEIHPNFDYLSAHAFLRKIANGEQIIDKLTWDLTGPQPVKVKESYDLRGVELLIFEGEFTLCDENTYDFVKHSDVRIAIDADDKDIIDWDWKRARDPGTSHFDEFAASKTKSLSRYRKLQNPLTNQYADFVVTKENKHQYKLMSNKLSCMSG